jgi:hypothetical protein
MATSVASRLPNKRSNSRIDHLVVPPVVRVPDRRDHLDRIPHLEAYPSSSNMS